jgi:hypothetical protein
MNFELNEILEDLVYQNNIYHSGITYQQVQHAHFGPKSSPIVVSHEKNKNFNSFSHFMKSNFELTSFSLEIRSRFELFLASFVKLI